MRFYDIDGAELDVNDPKLYIDENHMLAQYEAIQEMLYDYV
jgi:hypothetical protein